MTYDHIWTIVGLGIAIYVAVAVIRALENNASNWKRLDRIERMLEDLTRKDGDKNTDKDEPEQ